MAASFKLGILIVKITEVQNIIFNISKKSTNVVCSIKIAREKERERDLALICDQFESVFELSQVVIVNYSDLF